MVGQRKVQHHKLHFAGLDVLLANLGERGVLELTAKRTLIIREPNHRDRRVVRPQRISAVEPERAGLRDCWGLRGLDYSFQHLPNPLELFQDVVRLLARDARIFSAVLRLVALVLRGRSEDNQRYQTTCRLYWAVHLSPNRWLRLCAIRIANMPIPHPNRTHDDGSGVAGPDDETVAE